MEEQAGKIFASKFPTCNILDITVKRSDRVAGAYVYAKMRKTPTREKSHEKNKANRADDKTAKKETGHQANPRGSRMDERR
jgi:hypothetical protein